MSRLGMTDDNHSEHPNVETATPEDDLEIMDLFNEDFLVTSFLRWPDYKKVFMSWRKEIFSLPFCVAVHFTLFRNSQEEMLLSIQQKLQEFENPKLSAEIQETVSELCTQNKLLEQILMMHEDWSLLPQEFCVQIPVIVGLVKCLWVPMGVHVMLQYIVSRYVASSGPTLQAQIRKYWEANGKYQ